MCLSNKAFFWGLSALPSYLRFPIFGRACFAMVSVEVTWYLNQGAHVRNAAWHYRAGYQLCGTRGKGLCGTLALHLPLYTYPDS